MAADTGISATYSVVAFDSKNELLGSAVASRYLAVGAVVPHFMRGVGAVNTQHHHKVILAESILAIMVQGYDPDSAVKMALADDDNPEERQIIAIDVLGRKAAWTGSACQEPRCHAVGNTCVAAGNTLASDKIAAAMVESVDNDSKSPLLIKLLNALDTAESLGGDKRGKQAAALKIMSARREKSLNNVYDFRVDDSPDPLAELRRICLLRE